MATSSSLGQQQRSNSGSRKQPAGTRRHARKLKHTSFPCVVCGKAFQTQQAMAGHCSTHTQSWHNPMGNESFGPHDLPVVQGMSATSCMRVAVISNPSSFPFIHPLTNQEMMRVTSFTPPIPSMAFWLMAQHQIQVAPQAQLIDDIVFHSYTTMVWPCNAMTTVLPSLLHAYQANQPGVMQQADLTLRLGSSGSNSHGDKSKLLPLLEDGRHGKGQVVAMDGGDQSGEEGNVVGGLDLDLHL